MLCDPVHPGESEGGGVEDALVLGSLGDVWAMLCVSIKDHTRRATGEMMAEKIAS